MTYEMLFRGNKNNTRLTSFTVNTIIYYSFFFQISCVATRFDHYHYVVTFRPFRYTILKLQLQIHFLMLVRFQ